MQDFETDSLVTVDRVGTISSRNGDDVCNTFEAIDESMQLWHDTTFHLFTSLITIPSNPVDFVNEVDERHVFLSLIKRLTQFRFGHAGQLGHDLPVVGDKDKRTSIVDHRSGYQCLPGSCRGVH